MRSRPLLVLVPVLLAAALLGVSSAGAGHAGASATSAPAAIRHGVATTRVRPGAPPTRTLQCGTCRHVTGLRWKYYGPPYNPNGYSYSLGNGSYARINGGDPVYVLEFDDSGGDHAFTVVAPCPGDTYCLSYSFAQANVGDLYRDAWSYMSGTNIGSLQETGPDCTTSYLNQCYFRWRPVGPPKKQKTGPGKHPDAANPTTTFDDPVNTSTGAFLNQAADARLAGIGLPFAMTRSYDSGDTTQGPLGTAWTFSYGAQLLVQQNNDIILRSETGQQVEYTRMVDGSFVAVNAGTYSTLTAVANGYDLIRRNQLILHFDATGRLISIHDRNNRTISLTYDAGGLTGISDPVGRQIGVTHDGAGLITRVTLPDGRYAGYGYTNGLLTSVRDLRGGTTTYGYDAAGRLNSITDANGHLKSRATYDGNGRVIEVLDALDHRTTLSWDDATYSVTATDARGKAWKDVYSKDGVLLQRADPLGNTIGYEYDASLNLAGITDERGKRTAMTYDTNGNLLTRTGPAPSSRRETFTYDGYNDVTSATDGRGFLTSFGYDANGNLTSVTRPGNVITQLTRDPAGTGLLTAVTDPRGKTTPLGYDASGNLTSRTSPLGHKTTMGYDASGRMTSRIEARGNEAGALPDDYKTVFRYDDGDHLLSATDPLQHVWAWSYDAVGNVATQTDPNNHATGYAYYNTDLLKTVTAADTAATQYAYDNVGNLLTRTDANNHVTTLAYDDAGRLTDVFSPLNQHWLYGYDAAGNRLSTVDPAGKTTTSTYDELNRLSTVAYSDGTPDVQLGYDGNDNRTSMTDGAGSVAYTFDDLNRLTSLTRGTDTFSYVFDPNGNVTQRTYPGNLVTNSTYDNENNLLTTERAGSTTSYLYDPAGHLTKTTLPSGNGYVENRTYDKAGRLTRVQNVKGTTTLSQFDYAYNPGGVPTSLTSTPGGLANYGYDAADRLTSVCFAATCAGAKDPFIRYTYDGVGNRKTEARPEGTTTYAYNAGDQLTGTTGPAGAVNYGYDANGNETQAGAQTFAYDQANRMISSILKGVTTTYSYDGEGKRLVASSGAAANQKTKSLWDESFGLSELALERDGADTSLRSYTYGAKRLSYVSGTQTSYFQYDGLGSARNVTSSAGATQQSYGYEPFGADRNGVTPSGTQQKVTPVLECVEQIPTGYRAHWGYSNPNAYALSFPVGSTNTFSPTPADRGQPTYFRPGRFKDLFTVDFASGVTLSWALNGTTVKATRRSAACTVTAGADNQFKFTGQRLDAGTGLYDLGARQYDSGAGRFNGLDPLAASLRDPYASSYAYARNTPTLFLDPSGMGAVRANCSGGVPPLAVEVGYDAAAGWGRRYSGVGRALRTSSDPAVRSAAGRLLPNAGPSAFARTTAFRWGGGALTVAGAVANFSNEVCNGDDPWRSGIHAGLSGAFALTGATLAGEVCAMPTIATLGATAGLCVLGVGAAGGVSSYAGGKVADITWQAGTSFGSKAYDVWAWMGG